MPKTKKKISDKPKFARQSAEARREMLVEAGIACLAKDGILGFTIDRICAEARVSRGLITHHFKSIDGLLAAVYDTMYGKVLAVIEEPGVATTPEARLVDIIDAMFSREFFNRESLNIWLALWGEIANNPALLKVHRKQYARYRADIERALLDVAKARGLKIDAGFVAMMLVSLVDGLGVEWFIEPKLLSAKVAREACFKLLEPILGPLR
jgi:AcrR family transcriptional regulator